MNTEAKLFQIFELEDSSNHTRPPPPPSIPFLSYFNQSSRPHWHIRPFSLSLSLSFFPSLPLSPSLSFFLSFLLFYVCSLERMWWPVCVLLAFLSFRQKNFSTVKPTCPLLVIHPFWLVNSEKILTSRLKRKILYCLYFDKKLSPLFSF